MKKITEFELIGIGISLLLVCLIFSLIGKHVFDLEGDFLSAAATLFAAVVAMLLFNDWKKPFQASKTLSERNEILISIRQLRRDYYRFICLINDKKADKSECDKYKAEYILVESNLLLCLEELRDKLYIYLDNFPKKSDVDDSGCEPTIGAYIIQLTAMYKILMENDPLTEFDKAYENAYVNIKNHFFKNIVHSLTEDLRTYILSQHKKGH